MDVYEGLKKCKRVIAGINEAGLKTNKSCRDIDVISLCNGEGIRRPPLAINRALITSAVENCQSSFEKYSYLIRDNRLEEAIKKYSSIRKDLPVAIDMGSTRIFNNIFNHILPKQSKIFIEVGFYHSFIAWTHSANVCLCVTGDSSQHTAKTSLKSLNIGKGKYGAPAAVIIINPTYSGELYTQSELQGIIDWCRSNDSLLIEDAVFQGTEYGKTTARVLDVSRSLDNTISVNSVSKSLGLSNLRLGWVIGCEPLVHKLSYYSDIATVSIPFLTANIASEALLEHQDYKIFCKEQNVLRVKFLTNLIQTKNQRLICRLGGNRDWLAIKSKPVSGQNMFIYFPAIETAFSQLGLVDSADLCEKIANKSGVMLSPLLSSGYKDSTCRISFSGVDVNKGYKISQKYEVKVIDSVLKKQLVDITYYEQQLNNELSTIYIETLDIFEQAIDKIAEAVIDIVEGK
ncbi:hypothetical protein C9J12_21335 [Photobacterium frigidiphilum]|uniref:Aminotransferase n=1 Tax=Photobacterium frigidiphilum TaxID=264736 RepID=A0A2T3JAF2_9GAMM|nr:pyridoxal phosphate-dependent aminotransferase [Photobacterium frigidiphilum]PSU45785.1 hypothetical protein C9J12_21335 [Photobacterium frigidiphilum]